MDFQRNPNIARCLSLGAKDRIRTPETDTVVERVGGDGRFDLFNGRRNDFGQGFPVNSAKASGREDNTFSHHNITDCTCETYPVGGF